MKTFFVINKQDSKSEDIGNRIKKALIDHYEYNEDHPDLVITVGGDGTMLRAVNLYSKQLDKTNFLGIHTGTLGFYTDYNKDEVDVLIHDVLKKEFQVKETKMVEVNYLKNNYVYTYYGLNEVRIESIHSTLVCDVFIDDEFLETFRGNGLCISSSSGSTAYNRSIGGSVFYEGLELLQLSEIAGIHHNAYRSLQSSLVLDKEKKIKVVLRKDNTAVLGIDQMIYDLNHVEEVVLSLSNKTVKFASFRCVSFIDRIRRAFING